MLAVRSNEILTAVVHGARKDEPSVEVQASAMNALYNSLPFIRENFEREGERNYIMQVRLSSAVCLDGELMHATGHLRGDTEPEH